jgi:hypothetical protein
MSVSLVDLWSPSTTDSSDRGRPSYPELTRYLANVHARGSFARMIAAEKAMLGG